MICLSRNKLVSAYGVYGLSNVEDGFRRKRYGKRHVYIGVIAFKEGVMKNVK